MNFKACFLIEAISILSNVSFGMVGGTLLASSPKTSGVAGLIITNEDGEPKRVCVGSLIAADTILTVAHCLIDIKNPKIYVVFSKAPLNTVIEAVQEGQRLGLQGTAAYEAHFSEIYKASGYAFHPKASLPPKTQCDPECAVAKTAKYSEFDLATIKLLRPVKDGKVLKLPTSGDSSTVNSVRVIGCGVETFQGQAATSEGIAFTPRMKESEYSVLSSPSNIESLFPASMYSIEVQKSIGTILIPGFSSNGPFFMVSEQTQHTLEEGDSGAPALVETADHEPTIVGIHTMNVGFANSPAFGTFVNLRSPAVNAWIKEQMNPTSTSHSTTAP